MTENITPQNNENGQDPSSQVAIVDVEKRLKDTQAYATKARQNEINAYKLLVETNPIAITKIEDEKIKEKILQENWWVDTIEELNIYFPDVLKPSKKVVKKSEEEEDDEEDEVTKLKREVELIKLHWTKTKINNAIDELKNVNKEIIETIPDFEEKIKEELKNISSTLEEKERVAKAFVIVTWWAVSKANAYWIIQWASWGQITQKKEENKEDAELLKKQNELRRALWLKEK